MAKVRVVRPQPKPVKVYLQLTEGEADFILGLTSRVGGHPTKSPRKYANRLRDALRDALGYSYDETDSYKLINGDVFMVDYGTR